MFLGELQDQATPKFHPKIQTDPNGGLLLGERPNSWSFFKSWEILEL